MLNICYSPHYFAHTHTNSMEKLSAVANAISELDGIQLHAPSRIDPNILKQLHDPNYVDAFLTGTPEKLATFQGLKLMWFR